MRTSGSLALVCLAGQNERRIRAKHPFAHGLSTSDLVRHDQFDLSLHAWDSYESGSRQRWVHLAEEHRIHTQVVLCL